MNAASSLQHPMTRYLACLMIAQATFLHAEAIARPPINDKPAPENREDLLAIQSAVTSALPNASAATVAIEITEGSGTGVIVSPDGLILTAAHVSGAPGKKVEVIMQDGKRVKAITLGLDSESDAAMMRITDPGTWPFVDIDKNESFKLGDWVFALGHSGGFDKERGLVLRPGRIVRIAEKTLQSDCILIGGDSGGPLFDLNGRLIAIHSRVGPQLVVNMHVGIDVFHEKWDALMNSEFLGEGPFAKKPVKGNGYLGIATQSTEGGLEVTKIGINSPAQKAGIRRGDLLLKINDTPLKSRSELQELLSEHSAGDEIRLEIQSEKTTRSLTLKLDER